MDICVNKTLRVAVLHHAAFHLEKIGNTWTGVNGRDFEILKILSSKMNFRYDLVPSVDKKWGSCDEEGNCEGLIGMIVREEVNMSISSLTSTAARAKYVDFSYPYFQDEVTFATKNPDLKLIVNTMFFAKPFDIKVWIFMACFLSIFLVVTKVLKWLKIVESTKIFQFKNLMAIILRQEASLEFVTQSGATLITMSLLITFAGCACKIYDCTLTSVTSMTSTTKLVDTIQDMVEAILEDGFVIGAIKGTAPHQRIMTSDIEYLKIFANSSRSKDNYIGHKTHKEGLLRALRENFAAIATNSLLRKTVMELGLKISMFHFASDYLFLDQNSVAFGKTFPCKYAMNQWLVVVAGSGLIAKWDMRSNWLLNRESSDTVKHSLKLINLKDLKLVLAALLLGYTLAIIVLLLEIVTSKITEFIMFKHNSMSD